MYLQTALNEHRIMSEKGKPQHNRGDKKYFKKSHEHQPRKGKGNYRRNGRKNFKQANLDQILDKEYE